MSCRLKLELKIDEKIITPITAIAAAAKFGLPSVPITELYGLFHETKSLPVVCKSEYIKEINPKKKVTKNNFFTLKTRVKIAVAINTMDKAKY